MLSKMLSLTIAYLTFRQHPKFEWFARSLDREFRSMPDVDREAVQVLVIDGQLWSDEDRRLKLLEASEGRIKFEHHPPKPTVWQGPHRFTKRDYFCAANTRNTAFALSQRAHVAFIDDLSVLLPGWLKAHVHAAMNGYVLCGTTCKHKHIVVNESGDVIEHDEFPPGIDSRMKHLLNEDLRRCPGGWLYGGTFSVPTEHALRVNGQDEIHDTIGGEDYDFGERLERSGSIIYISRTCGTFEDEDGHHAEAPMVRLDKPWPPVSNKSPRALSLNGWTDSAEPNRTDGPYSSNYLFNRLRRDTCRFWTLGNTFKLSDLRDYVLAGNPFPKPDKPVAHWVDGQPLSEM